MLKTIINQNLKKVIKSSDKQVGEGDLEKIEKEVLEKTKLKVDSKKLR